MGSAGISVLDCCGAPEIITSGGAGDVLSETGERRGVSGAPMAEARDDDAVLAAVAESGWGAELVFAGDAGDEGPGDGELPCLEPDGLDLPSELAFVLDSCKSVSGW